ncbi:F-box/WD repeat-containing protein 12 [Heteronotia binoei]|uniref:F-box/WD repeat-containing protein 12 n=1 Tax=Heteronotia binoei TaxID=13085 RepID=UPI00292E535F|nr:F-box/WD repeat-containing protein 12 [Heteronotia binoei]
MSDESLTLDCLVHIFSYLEAPDLLRVAQVNKTWLEATETASLWRNMCLNQWTFCNISVTPGMQTWKKYYLHRSNIEHKMLSGRPSVDYTCKAMRGHQGEIQDMAYLSPNEHTFAMGKVKSIVCTASGDGTVKAWDVQESTQIWSSPKQEMKLVQVITLPEHNLVVTRDLSGTIKLWQGDTGKEVGAFSAESTFCPTIAYTINNKPFLSVATSSEKIYTLAVPDLSQISCIKPFPNCGVDLSPCSPDGQSIVVLPLDSNQAPKVLYTHYATNPEDDQLMFSSPLPINNSVFATCWLPAEPARIALMHGEDQSYNITTFDITIQKSKYKMNIMSQQVATFRLPSKHIFTEYRTIAGFGKQTLVIAFNMELKVYSLNGAELNAFQDHVKTITSIWVDPFRVVTSSLDLSLRVYTWKNDNKTSSLVSRYHLVGGSHRWSRGFTNVACDDVSIVGVVAGVEQTDILRAYSFDL